MNDDDRIELRQQLAASHPRTKGSWWDVTSQLLDECDVLRATLEIADKRRDTEVAGLVEQNRTLRVKGAEAEQLRGRVDFYFANQDSLRDYWAKLEEAWTNERSILNERVQTVERERDALHKKLAVLMRDAGAVTRGLDALRAVLATLHRAAVTHPRWVTGTVVLEQTCKVLTEEQQRTALEMAKTINHAPTR